jgi:hypothetical protein
MRVPPAVYALPLALALAACSGLDDAPPETTVQLDVFSGEPNPQWRPTSTEAAQILDLLHKLHPLEGVEPPPPRLGYRGFILSVGHADSARLYDVGFGLVVTRPSPHRLFTWRDDGLEALLLEQARRYGQDHILSAIMK